MHGRKGITMSDELIMKAQKHDKEAFSQLMRQQKMSMYKVAKAILKSDDDIADAMQDTILTCWEKIDTLRKTQYFKTWLIRILINNCKAIYKKNSKELLTNEFSNKTMVDGNFTDIEWQEMMTCLNEKQRIVIELYYVEGFKVREIAQILHIGQSAVKGRLQSARKNLEAYYNEVGM